MDEITTAEKIVEETWQNIFDSIDRLSKNHQVLEAVSSYSYLADFYLKRLAETTEIDKTLTSTKQIIIILPLFMLL